MLSNRDSDAGVDTDLLSRRSVRSRAPLRMSLAGGGTDVPPYSTDFGGAVLSATINRYAWCTISGSEEDEITVRSLDLNAVATFSSSTIPVFDGNLDLIKAVFRRLNVPHLGGLKVVLQTDAPPGSGLGSSSALVVAVISGLSMFFGLELTPHEIARVAYVVERDDLGIAGGMQDQYSAAFGGFNFIEFHRDVEVLPIRLSTAMRREMESHFLLCFTGATRSSGGILERQIANVATSRSETMDGLHGLKRLALELRRALHSENLSLAASLLDQGWEQKKALTNGISNSHLDSIYAVAKSHGAMGGKLLGAGGGGYFLFLVEPELMESVAGALEPLGVSISKGIEFCESGVVSWEVPRVRSAMPLAFAKGAN